MNAALRFAFRSLRRTPGFTAMAIAILTLGIGATTAMFSITNTVVFKPLAYRDPGQLASLMLHVPAFAKFGDKIPQFHVQWMRQPLLLLFGAVGLVQIIVCTHLMTLMLACSSARQQEWTGLLAMGAGLRQLLRNTFAESLVLSLAGGVLDACWSLVDGTASSRSSIRMTAH